MSQFRGTAAGRYIVHSGDESYRTGVGTSVLSLGTFLKEAPGRTDRQWFRNGTDE